MEDWEVVDRPLDSTKKALQAVNSHLLDKAAWTAAGTIVWVFLTALKVNMNRALHNAMQVHNVQRRLEELEQCILVLEQEPCDREEAGISDSQVVSVGDDEPFEMAGMDSRCQPHRLVQCGKAPGYYE